MAESDFYTSNKQRTYPFINNTTSLSNEAVVDAGFIVSPKQELASRPEVVLDSINITGGTYIFTFSSSIVFGSWTFTCTQSNTYYKATLSTDSYSGAYLVTGDLSKVTSDLTPGVVVEDSCVQYLGSIVTTTTIGNDRRPESDCTSGATVSSSSNSGTELASVEVFDGDVINLKEGYNCQIDMDYDNNKITILPNENMGCGKPCNTMPGYPEGYFDTCRCIDAVKSINGVRPSDGNIEIRRGSGVELIPDTSNKKLTIKLVGGYEQICNNEDYNYNPCYE